jgi:hypothetical protein
MRQPFTQLSPGTQNERDSGDEFRAALVAKERALLELLGEAEEAAAQYAAEVKELRQYLADLVPIMQHEGLNPHFKPGPDRSEPPVGTAGNRSSNMPPRKEWYEDMPLTDAVAQLLANGEEWHADDLVRAIFIVQDHKQHRAAKATLASALSAGVKRERWDRVVGKGNTFQRKAEEMAGDL